MRRTRFFRGLASIFAVWLAICMAEPMQLHTCVMHGGLAMAGSMHGMSAASMDSNAMLHGSSDGANAAASSGRHDHHGNRTDDQSNQCTCLGDCSGGKTPVVLAAAPVVLATLQIGVPTLVFSYVSPSVRSPQFVLPFPNGPPGASSRA